MASLTSLRWQTAHSLYSMRRYGKIQVSEATNNFGFQVHARVCPENPSIVFSLTGHGAEQSAQFGVRLNFSSGEIWDCANDTGLIGSLEQDILEDTAENPATMLLRWEIEHLGGAMIPRLQIGEEEWLYPSVRFPGDAQFTAEAGHDLDGVDVNAVFSPGYVWCQDRLRK